VRAIVLEEYGGPEVLRVRDVPDPDPGPDEVVVDVVATALNRADLLQRLGLYPQPGPRPEHEIPGLELAGRVAALGRRVTAWSVGDEVMGIVGGGAHAERIAVHERQLVAVPLTVPLRDAAAIPEVFLTAWDALVLQGALTSGRLALVHAGASGVGTAAIQVARAIGARVAVTASAGKLDACRALGADLAIDRATAWEEQVGDVDVVLDVVGGGYTVKNLQVLRVGGRIVQVGVMDPAPVTLPLGMLLPKRATIVGTVLRSRPLEEKIAVSQRFAREVVPLFDSGALRPVIDRRYPLDHVADAHRHMEANANVGKIVLDVER
jgi:putative PIG3 family NAD(P)H quinone oxidoreductase